MTPGQARDFAWIVAEPILVLLLFGAVLLLGFALLREVTR